MGVAVASRHQAAQAEHLESIVRQRVPCLLATEVTWQEAARAIWEALYWSMRPQKEGMPHVYHGSPWRSRAREGHLAELRILLEDRVGSPNVAISDGADSVGVSPSSMSSAESSGASRQLWADLIFVYQLWLEYNPHTANWGRCPSYGLPPLHMCWHNRWREDLRHVLADLARHCLRESSYGCLRGSKEWAAFVCLMGALDHVLSWDVMAPNLGRSELIGAGTPMLYAIFSNRLEERFAFAWGAAKAPAVAEVDLVGFDAHVEDGMATRLPVEPFRGLWGSVGPLAAQARLTESAQPGSP